MDYSIKNEFQYNQSSNEDVNKYINDRILAQIEWYDNKSIYYQNMYKRFSIISIILSAIIPVFTLALDFNCAIIFRFIIAFLGAAISIISGILSLNKYKELWVQYRTNCEILKSVLHRYCTRTGEFNSRSEDSNFEKLVTSCEQYLTKEFDSWNKIYSNQNQSSTGS